MNAPVAIRIENLGKRYKIGSKERYKTLREIFSPGRLLKEGRNGPPEFVWALRNVSLEIRHGEAVGIVGNNGAGKTTLLKILSRITEPTEGQAAIHGRVGSLLEVGTGFHPELSGRDNVYLSGAILGMSRSEIRRKFDEIVQFSGVDQFIDTPMKRYSSGMQVRLAFAIAAHLEPEILLIDEVLAVGDISFQEKCLGKMEQVASSGRTILFVSHNMSAIRSLCTKAVLVDKGEVQMVGSPDEVIQAYTDRTEALHKDGQTLVADRKDRSGNGKVRVVSFEARGPQGRTGPLRTGAEAEFIIGYASKDSAQVPQLIVTAGVVDLNGNPVFGFGTGMSTLRFYRNVPSPGFAVCTIKNLPLLPGKYWVTVALKVDQGLEGVSDQISKAGGFTVIDDGSGGFLSTSSIGKSWGSVAVPHSWDWQPAGSELAPKA